MKIPPFVYAKAFWEALALLLAGVLALLAFFAVIPASFAFGAGAILAAILSVLKAFDIVPELRDKGILPPKFKL